VDEKKTIGGRPDEELDTILVEELLVVYGVVRLLNTLLTPVTGNTVPLLKEDTSSAGVDDDRLDGEGVDRFDEEFTDGFVLNETLLREDVSETFDKLAEGKTTSIVTPCVELLSDELLDELEDDDAKDEL